jgi:glutaredoxin
MEPMKIYSKQNCPRCEQVKQYASEKGVKFATVDITNDMVKLMNFREQFPGAGFPVVEFADGVTLPGSEMEEIKNKINTLA